MVKKFGFVGLALCVITAVYFIYAPKWVEARLNPVQPVTTPNVSSAALALHQQLFVADWHNDALLWQRDLTLQSSRGQVDFPRMQQGNVGLLVFTTVTQVPMAQNYRQNASDQLDKITPLVVSQRWPVRTWQSPLQRALYQSEKLHRFIQQSVTPVRLVTSQQSLKQLLEGRKYTTPKPMGAMLGIEGAQALEADLANVDTLYKSGFRVIGLQHFHDNAAGGSMHGESKAGLTKFGRDLIKTLNEKSMIIDLAHASEQTVRDVLALSAQPVIVSHTGVYGVCASPRNLPDSLLLAISQKGGLIGIGFWAEAVCDHSPAGIAKTIQYAVDLFGIDHVSLGSDFNGSVATTFDVSELALLTDALLQTGFSPEQVHKIMGGNIQRFLAQQLPLND